MTSLAATTEQSGPSPPQPTPCAPARYLAGQEGTPGNGPFMTVVLHVVGDLIDDAKFQTYPCPVAHSCGQFVAEFLTGKRLSEAAALGECDIVANIGQMPLGRQHCPGLAINALRKALN